MRAGTTAAPTCRKADGRSAQGSVDDDDVHRVAVTIKYLFVRIARSSDGDVVGPWLLEEVDGDAQLTRKKWGRSLHVARELGTQGWDLSTVETFVEERKANVGVREWEVKELVFKKHLP